MAEHRKACKIIEEARRWVGTPYHHQAATRGVGCDCLGLVRGVYEEICGAPSEAPPPYTADWGVTGAEEVLIKAAQRHLMPITPKTDFGAGDVLIFRYRSGMLARHMAIATSTTSMIHAYEGSGVIEVPISNWWRRRLAAAFRFPDEVRG